MLGSKGPPVGNGPWQIVTDDVTWREMATVVLTYLLSIRGIGGYNRRHVGLKYDWNFENEITYHKWVTCVL